MVRDSTPRGVAKDYLPRILHGDVEPHGEPWTLLDAQMTLGPRLEQAFETRHLVKGSHLDWASPLAAIRWIYNLPAGPTAWMDQGSQILDWGEIEPWSIDGNAGLRLNFASPRRVQDAGERPIHAVTALMHMLTTTDIQTTSIEWLIGDTWCSVIQRVTPPQPALFALLAPPDIQLTSIAEWLNMSETLGRYPFVATAELSPVEVAVQVYATALEGLHKRLNPLSQMSYVDRLCDLLAPIYCISPELFGFDLEEWIKVCRDLRNFESHLPGGNTLLTDHDERLYAMTARSLQWILRLRLLLELFDPATLRKACERSNELAFVLANNELDRSVCQIAAATAAQ